MENLFVSLTKNLQIQISASDGNDCNLAAISLHRENGNCFGRAGRRTRKFNYYQEIILVFRIMPNEG